MTEQGYILPEESIWKDVFRKPGLPILMVRFPDGREIPYWNTFIRKWTIPKSVLRNLWKLPICNTCRQRSLHRNCPWAVRKGKAGGYFAGNRSGAKSRKADKRTDYNDLELHGAAPVLSWSDGSEYPVAKGVGVLPWSIKDTGRVWCQNCETGCICLCTEETGRTEFLNQPDTWELLNKIKQIAEPYGMELLPEIHESYSEKYMRR